LCEQPPSASTSVSMEIRMSKNRKHTDKMQKHWRKCVEQTEGEINTVQTGSGTKDQYIVGNKKCSYVWHSSPSTSNVVKYKMSDLNRMSRQLGINKEWGDYKNENTIYMFRGCFNK